MDFDKESLEAIAAALAQTFQQMTSFQKSDFSSLPDDFRRDVFTRAGDICASEGSAERAKDCYVQANIQDLKGRLKEKLLEYGRVNELLHTAGFYCPPLKTISMEDVKRSTVRALERGQLYDALEGFNHLGDIEGMRDVARQYAEQGRPRLLLEAYEHIGEEVPIELLIQSADNGWESENHFDRSAAEDAYVMTGHKEGILKAIDRRLHDSGCYDMIPKLYETAGVEITGVEILERIVNEARTLIRIEILEEKLGVTMTQDQYTRMGDRFFREESFNHAIEAYQKADNKERLTRTVHAAIAKGKFYDAGNALGARGYDALGKFVRKLNH